MSVGREAAIDWLLANRGGAMRGSRWIVSGCALAVLALASFPHNALGRVAEFLGLAVVAGVFLVWLALVLATVFHPRFFERLAQRRAETAQSQKDLG